MPYYTEGTLTTDIREVAIDTMWDSQSDWEAYQSAQNVDITNGVVSLDEFTIPQDGLIHHHPGTEGSGTTVEDVAADADMTLNGPTWVARQDFEGGWGIFFDGIDDYATATLMQPTARTRFIRIDVTDMMAGGLAHRNIWTYDNEPKLAYHVSGERWDYRDGAGSDLEVSDSLSAVESEIRILVARMDSSTQRLDVYDGSGTFVNGGSSSSPNTSYSSSEMFIGAQQEDTGDRLFGEGAMDPQFLNYNQYLTDQEVQDVLDGAYLQ